VTGTAQDLKEATLTFGYDPVASFELRIEGRYDTSSEPTFVKTETPSLQYGSNQSELALQGVYKF
ncbi:MAG: outer membrane beta-barrel protein, partial [Steroidobacteraceae bacterium]